MLSKVRYCSCIMFDVGCTLLQSAGPASKSSLYRNRKGGVTLINMWLTCLEHVTWLAASQLTITPLTTPPLIRYGHCRMSLSLTHASTHVSSDPHPLMDYTRISYGVWQQAYMRRPALARSMFQSFILSITNVTTSTNTIQQLWPFVLVIYFLVFHFIVEFRRLNGTCFPLYYIPPFLIKINS